MLDRANGAALLANLPQVSVLSTPQADSHTLGLPQASEDLCESPLAWIEDTSATSPFRPNSEDDGFQPAFQVMLLDVGYLQQWLPKQFQVRAGIHFLLALPHY